MMRDAMRAIADNAFVWLVTVGGTVLLVSLLPEDVRGDIEWASWFSGAGAFAAVAVAIYLATRDERRRREEADAVAKLTAAGVTYRLSVLSDNLQGVLEWLDKDRNRNGDYTEADLKKAAFYLRDAMNWTMADLLPLSPLPDRCAIRLAAGLDSLKACLDIMRATTLDENFKNPKYRGSQVVNLHKTIGKALEHLDHARKITTKYSGLYDHVKN